MTEDSPTTPERDEHAHLVSPWPTPPSAPPTTPPTTPTALAAPTWPSPPWPSAATEDHTATKRRSGRFPALLALVAVIALLAGAAGATIGVAVSGRSSTASDPSSIVTPDVDAGNGSGSSGGSLIPGSGSNVGIDVDTIASKVNPAIVNIATTLSGGQQAAGSGMVLTSSGEVLTNNHVINGATQIEVEIGVTGKTYTAKVLGYDVEDDVALLKLNNASGMKTITIADSSSVSTNDPVVAIGNALGRFGTPTAVAGSVTALHQQITAGDGLDEESLSDMIRIAASIQPGDSGGALVNDSAEVIGMNTAADAGSGRFGYSAGTTGFAIPIENALTIADEIKDGDTSNGAHIGDRALLGVVLQDTSSSDQRGSGEGSSDGTGAAVADVGSDTPAEQAGMEAGDVITRVGSAPIRSIDDLRSVLDRYHPDDKVSIEWTDASGDGHRATVTLTKGPPA